MKENIRGIKEDPTSWFCKPCMQKEINFSNINDTEYTHLIKDLKDKPKKITKETIIEQLNLFSDNKNNKCEFYMTEQFRENVFDKFIKTE